MTSAVAVGDVHPDDHDRVGDLVLAAYDAVGAIASSYRDELHDTRARSGPGTSVLVARLGDEVVGTVTVVAAESEHFEHTGHGDGGMRALAVSPARQGLGAGAALVDAVLAHGVAEGWRRISLTSMSWMQGAHGLYQRRGFVRRPDRDVRYSSGVGLVFQLDLVPDAAGCFPVPGPVPADPPHYTRTRTSPVSC